MLVNVHVVNPESCDSTTGVPFASHRYYIYKYVCKVKVTFTTTYVNVSDKKSTALWKQYLEKQPLKYFKNWIHLMSHAWNIICHDDVHLLWKCTLKLCPTTFTQPYDANAFTTMRFLEVTCAMGICINQISSTSWEKENKVLSLLFLYFPWYCDIVGWGHFESSTL